MPEDADLNSSLAEIEQIPALRPLLLGAVSLCLLLSVALWNGYPTVFSDTGGYLLTGATFLPYRPFRAPGYSIFVRLTSLRSTAWFTIFMQAVIVLYVLDKTCGYLIGGRRKFRSYVLLGSVGVLAALTSLPWVVSELMPDVFAGVFFLSAFLLALDGQLSLMERFALAAILMLSVSSHMSLFPIAAIFVGTLAVSRLAGSRCPGAPPTRIMLAWLLAPVIASGLWTAGLNQYMGLGFQLSPSRSMFLLGRLFDEGLAADFLDQNCTHRHFIACRYLSNLPRNSEEFLFQHPLLNDIEGHPKEMEEIVRGTLAAYPVRFATSSIRGTLLQLTAIRTGDEIRSYGAWEWNNSAIKQVFPGDFSAFSHSRQFRGSLISLADAAAMLHTTTFWLSTVTCLLLVWKDRMERVNYFLSWIIVFFIINAAVCATFSGVYDRYQSRVAWLMPLCFIAYVCRLLQESNEVEIREQSCGREISAGEIA